MFTVCPKCALTLVVTAADLRVAQGYVRCGRCSSVFNALAQLSDDRSATAAAESEASLPEHEAEESQSPARAVADDESSETAAAAAADEEPSRSPAPAAEDDDSIPEYTLEFNPATTDAASLFVVAAPSPEWTAATGSFKAHVPPEPEPAVTAPEPKAQEADEDFEVELDAALLSDIVQSEHVAEKPARPIRETPAPAAPPPKPPPQAATPHHAAANRPEAPAAATRPATVANATAPAASNAPAAATAKTAAGPTARTPQADAVATPATTAPKAPPTGAAKAPAATTVRAPGTAAAPTQADTATKTASASAAAAAAAKTPAAPAPARTPAAPAAKPSLPPAAKTPLAAIAARAAAAIAKTPPAPAAKPAAATETAAQGDRALDPLAPAASGDVAFEDFEAVAGTSGQHAGRPQWQWAAGSVLLLLILFVQIINHQRDALATDPRFSHSLTAVYTALGVQLTPRWDLRAYDVRQLGATVEAGGTGAITVRASIRNAGSRPQPLPLLRVTLQDRFGNRLASRDVLPHDYLPSGTAPTTLLAQDQRIDAELAFVDPGASAVGFELDACLPLGGGTVCANDTSAR